MFKNSCFTVILANSKITEIDINPFFNFGQNFMDSTRPHNVVAAEQPAVLSLGFFNSKVHVFINSASCGLAKISNLRACFLIGLNDLLGIVGRPSVKNNDLGLIGQLRDDAL